MHVGWPEAESVIRSVILLTLENYLIFKIPPQPSKLSIDPMAANRIESVPRKDFVVYLADEAGEGKRGRGLQNWDREAEMEERWRDFAVLQRERES